MHISSIWIIWYGQFWKFIHDTASEYFPDLEVLISSRSHTDTLPLEKVCKADIVFPCGPINYMAEQLHKIIPLMWKNSLLWEITTVKVMPEKILSKSKNLKYICSHPMFGPESYKKNNNNLRWCTLAWCSDSLSQEDRKLMLSFLETYKLRIVHMSADQHDKNLAETLFLTHYISQIVYQAWFDRSAIDTLSFWYLMDAVESVKDNKDLFVDVWKNNPYCKQVVERFSKTNQNILHDFLQDE